MIVSTDGNFYGTTLAGGAGGNGTLFAMTADGTLTTLFSFSGNEDGAGPNGVGQGGDGNLYGSTTVGGANGAGTVFTLVPGGTVSTLADFAAPAGFADGSGSLPYSATSTLTGTDGNTYGVTMNCGNYDDSMGAVFVQTPDGTVTTLFSFDSDGQWNYPDGSNPFVLIQGSDGNLYGATSGGGANNSGTIFELSTDGGNFTTLVSFDYGNTGAYPNSLVLGGDGNFYGTTISGGPGGSGTIFKLAADGTLTTVYAFSGGNDGAYPANLVQGNDGNMYGVTSGGGAYNSGTLFQLTPDGTLNTLVTYQTGGPIAFPLLFGTATPPVSKGPIGGSGSGAGGGTTTGHGKATHKASVTCAITGGTKARNSFSSKTTLRGTATGTSGVKLVQYQVNGGAYKLATGTKNWTVSTASLKLGKNTIVVRVTNSQGQQTTQTIVVNRRR
jgi:uncharacterized repeat protein (TIGR03803 family)